MVKGISRQVIVVHAPDPKLFEQAIFILKDDVVTDKSVTDEDLLREAKRLINSGGGRKRYPVFAGPLWACGGALLTGAVWLLCALI